MGEDFEADHLSSERYHRGRTISSMERAHAEMIEVRVGKKHDVDLEEVLSHKVEARKRESKRRHETQAVSWRARILKGISALAISPLTAFAASVRTATSRRSRLAFPIVHLGEQDLV